MFEVAEKIHQAYRSEAEKWAQVVGRAAATSLPISLALPRSPKRAYTIDSCVLLNLSTFLSVPLVLPVIKGEKAISLKTSLLRKGSFPRDFAFQNNNMSLSTSASNHRSRTFLHSPLDLSQRSIRLLRIQRSRSTQGHIQCIMRHTTVESNYTCLSYVWGPPDEGYPVLLNEKLHFVRKNLFAFLQYAEEKDFGWLWIDALCIDQANDAERTHQVQQMGAIFAQAAQVISWLGDHPYRVEFLRSTARDQMYFYYAELFAMDTYWTRAWVTQEILLARNVILMAGRVTCPMQQIRSRYVSSFSPLLKAATGTDSNITHANLVYLLDVFRQQECEIARDRIFSLLALSGDAMSLQVDYGISDEELTWRVFLLYKHRFCLCTLYVVSRALSASSETLFVPNLRPPHASPNRAHLKTNKVYLSDKKTLVRFVVFDFSRSDQLPWSETLDEMVQSGTGPIRTSSTQCIFIRLALLCQNIFLFAHPGLYSKYLALYRQPARPGFQYHVSTFDQLQSVEPNALQYWPEPLNWDVDEEGSGTIYFSLSFLLQVTKVMGWGIYSGGNSCGRARGEKYVDEEPGIIELVC